MHLLDTKPDSGEILQTAVEVEIWEGYLLRSKTNAGKTLCTYSLDNGPLNECSNGNLLFRFTGYDWQHFIRQYLDTNNIHYCLVRELSIDALRQLLRKKIYIVEDDPDILLTLADALENAGYHVRASSSGKTVMDGNYSSVDLFILGNQTAGINGLDICRYLRNQSSTKNVPVILISAHPKKGDEALLAGANDYLEKPFQMHYLLNLIARYTQLNRW